MGRRHITAEALCGDLTERGNPLLGRLLAALPEVGKKKITSGKHLPEVTTSGKAANSLRQRLFVET